MHRTETSTAQVNAALQYCGENNVNIFGPIREIGRAQIRRMTFEPVKKLEFKLRVKQNVKHAQNNFLALLKGVKDNLLSLKS